MPQISPAIILLLLIGAFYVMAGVVAARAALISLLLDRALAGISAERLSRREAWQAAWLLCAANMVLAGGAALLVLSDLAVPLFVASLVGQFAYLTIAAPRYFDVEDPPDAAGRRATRNAAIIYAIATVAVLWAGRNGLLRPWHELPVAVVAPILALVGCHVSYTLWRALQRVAPTPNPIDETHFTAGTPDIASLKQVAVMADYYRFPLWAMEAGSDQDLAPEALGLSAALCRDLSDWAEAYLDSLDPADPDKFLWTDEARAQHEAAGRALARRVAAERPDLDVHVFTSQHGIVPLAEGDAA